MPACARICPPLAITETCHKKSRQEGSNSQPYPLWGLSKPVSHRKHVTQEYIMKIGQVAKDKAPC